MGTIIYTEDFSQYTHKRNFVFVFEDDINGATKIGYCKYRDKVECVTLPTISTNTSEKNGRALKESKHTIREIYNRISIIEKCLKAGKTIVLPKRRLGTHLINLKKHSPLLSKIIINSMCMIDSDYMENTYDNR
jgi:hypothetical protein